MIYSKNITYNYLHSTIWHKQDVICEAYFLPCENSLKQFFIEQFVYTVPMVNFFAIIQIWICKIF